MNPEDWSLTDAQRSDTVVRIRANMSSMAFFRGTPLAPEIVEAAAVAVEKKAYTVARVEARTTTGFRPHHETLKAYVRKLSALVLEIITSGSGELATAGPAVAEDSVSLDLTGAREFLTRETAEELLAPMLASGSKIRHIKFSTKSFGVEAAEVASAAIRNVSSTLEDADMSDIIAGRPEDEALAALRIISQALASARLKSLNLSDNALGEKGIRACAAAFQNQPALESIAFQNVGCSVHGCAALNELLQTTSSLKRFHLLNNMSGDDGAISIARVLSRCPAMEDFKMASSRVGAEGGIALAKALSMAANGGGFSSLVSLDIHDNPMTAEAAEDVANVIRHNSSLRRLNLNDTCLTDDGILVVAEALRDGAPSLESLDLELNEITPVGADALSQAIARKKGLRRLNLRENEIEDDGALAIAQGIVGLTSLQTLDLCTNQIKRGGACAVAKAVANMPDLQLLALDDNEISDAGVEVLKGLLRKAGKLDALGSLDENCPDEDDEEGDDEGQEQVDSAIDALTKELQQERLI